VGGAAGLSGRKQSGLRADSYVADVSHRFRQRPRCGKNQYPLTEERRAYLSLATGNSEVLGVVMAGLVAARNRRLLAMASSGSVAAVA
jgi:hypothetical protein